MRLFLFFLVLLCLCGTRSVCWAAEKEPVRLPAVAGAFYPKEANLLNRMIDGFLAKASFPSGGARKPFILIVPHAGYVYSGQTAAYSYKILQSFSFDTVILIGPSHRVPVTGASVWTNGNWQTPLGEVPVDSQMAAAIAGARPEFGFTQDAHLMEHSLEVQVPFLQKVLKKFKIVPILVNDDSPVNCQNLAKAVFDAVRGKNVVIIVSTDMSHYFSESTANQMDKLSLSLIEKKDATGLRREFDARRAELCGGPGVLTALEIDKLAGGLPLQVLDYSTSARASGDTSKVVGYGAVAFYAADIPVIKEPKAETVGFLSAPVQKELLGIARRTIENYVSDQKVYEPKVQDPILTQKRAAFVTLREHGDLRGCIGTLLPQGPLYLAVRDMAIQSATQDPRFRPVTPEELKGITIEISVLTIPVKVGSADEIVMGRHGVIVKRGMRQGVFLPKVAQETGWSKEEFLSELCSQKAGLSRDAWKDPATELLVFEAQDFSEKGA